MKRLRLIAPVTICGKDVFGRNAKITFFPYKESGWYWRCGNDCIPIDSSLAEYNNRRITLRYKRYTLEIYEHIGALRWTGLDGILIESTGLPPYHGRIAEQWNELKSHCEETGDKLSWFSPQKAYAYRESNRSVRIEPNNHQSLLISLFLDFKGLGQIETTYKFPGPLDSIFDAHALGQPNYYFYLSKFLGIFGWPHHKSASWKHDYLQEDLLRKISLHTAGDLLGAFSLITHDCLISGHVTSIRGGHRLDMGMIKKIASC